MARKNSIYIGFSNLNTEGYEVADEYKKYIPIELYEAMYNYEVELDD